MDSTMKDKIDIGGYHKTITTKSESDQQWVNHGLINLWGFNHFAAVKCFLQAIKEDQNCLFAYWGVAYSNGSHYNAIEVSVEAFQHGLFYLKAAEDKMKYGQEWERDLVTVLHERYPQNFKENPSEAIAKALIKFSHKMKKVYEKYNEDLQITALYVESIMNLNPWKLWGKDGQPTQQAIISKQILQKALKKGYCPQINHLYIHLMELSPHFRQSIPACDQLYTNVKGISHLLHMPSHIYIQMGDYLRSMESNLKAYQADNQSKKYLGEEISFYEFYRAHNVHFLVWAAMFLGDYQTAMKYSEIIHNIIDVKVLDMLGLYAENFIQVDFHVMIRFGKWQEILSKEIQTRPQFPLYKTTQRYARTIAYTILNRIKQAEEEMILFQEERKKITNRRYGNNSHQDVFDIAELMAKGELLYRKGQYEQAFNCLRKCVTLNDKLIYDEPWDWMQPPRHALGALLLEQNHFKQAQEVYLKDLQTYPNNIWSLTGLDQIYMKTGDTIKRQEISAALSQAQKNSKQVIKVSCFCKKQK